MKTLVHISDLHFGRVDESLLVPLTARVGALEPDLVALLGVSDAAGRVEGLDFFNLGDDVGAALDPGRNHVLRPALFT